eukprot:GFUD01015560.1.p1 GENE.GFUD01015560.1~~GFUD01015560.1.p1  ORF type:complete len:310 (+),score=74.80 GFUD01015560.1:97-1026(+)
MPPKKKGRTTRAKPKIVTLTPEEQKARDQCDLLLKDFDKQCEMTVNEARREVDTVAASINTLYKLELLKLPQDVKNMKWDVYYKQSLEEGYNPLALSDAISNCMDDSLCATVDTQVSQLKSAIRTTAKKRGNKKVSTENQPASATRTSSRSRATSRVLSDSSNLETPANSRSTRGTAKNTSAMATPANNRPPPNMGKTPMITPKFDTSALARTVSRVARSNEVLVSLSGSPVIPHLNPKSKAARAQESQAVLIPLGGGETLNIPLGGTQEMDSAHLDDDQIDRLEELQKSLANMLKMRRQVESSGGEDG